MFLAPRVLYGLNERFVLFPYALGGQYSKLVVRANALRALCMGDHPARLMRCGAPLVLGELYGSRQIFQVSEFIPVVMNGRQLHSLQVYGGAEWHLRWYRYRTLQRRVLRFEAGSKLVYPAHTQYYDCGLLASIARHLGEAREAKKVDREGFPQDRGPPAS
jgi:hypothetical protein